MSPRQQVSTKTRVDVFKRDGFTCQYCGAHPPGVLLHVDHIVPVAGGGGNEIDNLITACAPCNLGKGARELSAIPESLTDKASRIAEAESQLAGYSAVLEARRQRLEDDCFRVVEELTGEDTINRGWFQSIKMFVERLGVHEVLEAAELARARVAYHEAGRFKYFCAVCWNKIRGPQDEG